MGTIVEKQDVLFEVNEQTKNVPLEEEIYQQLNLTKLENLNVVPLEEIRRKQDKNLVKWCLTKKSMRLRKKST